MKKVGGRSLALAMMVLASLVFFLPSYPPLYKELPRWLRDILPDKGITLGLDLQGGIHLVLEVEEDRAVEIAVDRTAVGLQDLLVEKKIPAESVKRTGPSRITIAFQNAELKAQVQKMLDDFPTYVEVESAESANTVVWELREAEIKRIKDSAINQALETIRNRIDQFGVAEPLIQRQGLKQVVVQLPGIKDAKLAKDLIKQTALLEFKLLDDDNQAKLDLPGRIQKGKEREEALLKQAEGKIPEGDQILFERIVEKRQRPRVARTLLSQEACDAGRGCVERCAGFDRTVQRAVCLRHLRREGGERVRPDHRGKRQETHGYRARQ